MRIILPVLFSVLLAITSCQKPADYTVTDHGVIVQLKDQVIRLDAISEKIIRVSAAPGKTLPPTSSLSVIANANLKDFKVSEQNNLLLLTTPSIEARISLSTG